MESGKITGDAYMSKRTPKLIRKRKSRYFEVIAENKSPNPSPWMPIISINIGNSQSKWNCTAKPSELLEFPSKIGILLENH